MSKRLVRGVLASVCISTVTAVLCFLAGSQIAEESPRAHFYRTIYFPLRVHRSNKVDVAEFMQSRRNEEAQGVPPPPKQFSELFKVSFEKIDGGEVFVITPRKFSSGRTIVYLHSGAYVANMLPREWDIVKGLALRTGATAYVFEYPLAPRNDWRSTYRALNRFYSRLTTQVDPRRITLLGYSAGGGLALGFAEALRNTRMQLPAAVILLSPWLDLRLNNPEQLRLTNQDPLLSRAELMYSAKVWEQGADATNPYISPVFGSLTGLPPILMFSGTADILNADAHELVRNAHAAKVTITFVERRNMLHSWSMSPIPEAEQLYDEAAEFIRHAVPTSADSSQLHQR